MERDKQCPHYEICEEMHGENGDFGYVECPGSDKCIEPYNAYYDGLESTEYFD